LTDLKSLKRQSEFEAELKRSQDRAAGGGASRVQSGGETLLDNAQAVSGSITNARRGAQRVWWSKRGAKVALALGSVALLTALWFLLLRLGGGTKETSAALKKVHASLTQQPGPD